MQTSGLILLAGGASSRLQQAKQALPYKGTSLLLHSLQAARAVPASAIVVVLGAYTNVEIPEQDNLHVVANPDWKEGLASSIRCGLAALLAAAPACEQVILMVCDQPYVSPALLLELVDASRRENKSIAACTYKDATGTPVLFHRSYFGALASLQGDEGAKKIVRQNMHSVACVPFPGGEIDIDTPDDYQALLSSGQ